MSLTDNGTGTTMLVQPSGMGNYGGFGGFGGMDGSWLLLFILLCGGGMWGGFGGGMWPMMMGMGGGFGMDYLYPWLNNSQHISDGFRDQQLNNQISDARTDINRGFGDVQLGLAGVNQNICQTGNGIVNALNSGFNAAEIAANGRQMANMQGMNAINSNIADTRYTIATEACATRTTDTQNTNAIISALTAGIQSVKDQLCQDKIDAKNDEIAQLRQEVLYARGQASRVDQTARILAGQAAEIDGVYNRLKNCPVGTVPVAGNTPLFSCNPSFNGPGCGCGCA